MAPGDEAKRASDSPTATPSDKDSPTTVKAAAEGVATMAAGVAALAAFGDAPAAGTNDAADGEVGGGSPGTDRRARASGESTPSTVMVGGSAGASGSVAPVHAFWDTQPVPRLDDAELADAGSGGPIDPLVKASDIPATPYALLPQFEWSDVDVTDDGQLAEVYKLLNANYVEDDDAMFRFDYSMDFLRWALLPPGWHPEWHLGVRVAGGGKLVALITAIPARVAVYTTGLPAVEINFLCVHKKLRSKRLAPVLIKEITRRVNRRNIWQAAYTAGVVLPSPVVRCQYWHRSLQPKILIDVGFSRLPPRRTLSAHLRLNALPPTPATRGLRPMEARDVPAVTTLLRNYLSTYDLGVIWDEDEVRHWLLPRKGVVYSYVVEDPSGKVTDVGSFYSLPSTVLRHPRYKTLEAAYSFYNAVTVTDLGVLMKDLLILARTEGFALFNALDLMDNASVFADLKFSIGDGCLNYYLYNWRCPPMAPGRNSLVLL
ncbi:hypothetical protein BU14_1325s0002 [Porphyra umbilicalis]|uniref:Glycylpeptide N-tetradecanoyltransferase n=1 Tax=Porphyra umbilicalis TaxID=2786 RepID=A0A1X6NLW5_PORUM|nr:hypothetical protein BU14_1325s0002 [Porphyra umbilicalis]|eukprot:OSX69639.1 hypothetical protein BU14_1325s0002 [Porphyra umbilicalis]